MCSHHNVDLLLDLGKHRFVWDSDTLKHMMGSVVDRLCGPDEIDVGEAACDRVRMRWRDDLATTGGPWLR